jgi:hypothetical protein
MNKRVNSARGIKIGFTTTGTRVENQRNRTYNYRYEGRGPKLLRWGTTHWEAQDI